MTNPYDKENVISKLVLSVFVFPNESTRNWPAEREGGCVFKGAATRAGLLIDHKDRPWVRNDKRDLWKGKNRTSMGGFQLHSYPRGAEWGKRRQSPYYSCDWASDRLRWQMISLGPHDTRTWNLGQSHNSRVSIVTSLVNSSIFVLNEEVGAWSECDMKCRQLTRVHPWTPSIFSSLEIEHSQLGLQ